MAQIFPKWSNRVPKIVLIALLLFVSAIIFVFWFWFSPWNLEVGYAPKQPIPFNHKKHVGEYGIDCLNCHQYAPLSPNAGVPPTQVCMNCHTHIKKDSIKLEPLFESWNRDTPVPWVRVYKMPDYVYFDHSAHISNGVGCKTCHGRVDQMERVRVMTPLSMSWCLDCHRNPAPHLRPLDKVTDMEFEADDAWKAIAERKAKTLHPPVTSCSGCHR